MNMSNFVHNDINRKTHTFRKVDPIDFYLKILQHVVIMMTSIPKRGINGETPCAGSRGGSVATKAPQDTNASLKRFKDATKSEELSSLSKAFRKRKSPLIIPRRQATVVKILQ